MSDQRTLFSRHPLLILSALFVIAYASVFFMFAVEGHPKTQLIVASRTIIRTFPEQMWM